MTKSRDSSENWEEADKLSKSQWVTRCKHRWAERQGRAGHYKKMSIRCISWGGACKDIDEDPTLQGSSNKDRRETIKQLAKIHADILATSLEGMSDEERDYVEEGMEIMMTDIDKYSRGVG